MPPIPALHYEQRHAQGRRARLDAGAAHLARPGRPVAMHFSLLSGQEYTVPGMFIANLLDEPSAAMPVAPIAAPQPGPNAPPPAHNGPAYWIKVTAQSDGTFTVTNTRNVLPKLMRRMWDRTDATPQICEHWEALPTVGIGPLFSGCASCAAPDAAR